MARLTAEVLLSQPSRINPAKDRELDLRALRVGVIENLAVTQDSYDAIDLSDNSIQRLENLPVMKKLRCLLLSNNRIGFIEPSIGFQTPFLESLVLTNNRIANLSDILALGNFKSLETLSLMGNPVARNAHYRLLCIHSCKNIRLLDFVRVRHAEREAAVKFFSGKKGRGLLAEVKQSQLKVRGAPSSTGHATVSAVVDSIASEVVVRGEAVSHLHAAIERATNAAEVDRLKTAFQEGKLKDSRLNFSST